MDFSKLAVTEVRRNPTRTRIAVLASALAAMIVILLRIIPEGYPVGIAMPERTYTGGDIVIFPAQSPLSSAENSALVLRDWQGSDWQSQILYYFPDIVKTGYLCKEECMGWRAMVPKDVMTAISDIPNVNSAYSYIALPCLVNTGDAIIPAILRGFYEQPAYPLEPYIAKPGNFFSEYSVEDKEAIIPKQTKGLEDLRAGKMLHVTIPEPKVTEFVSQGGKVSQHIGTDWENATEYSLKIIGTYSIQIGEEIDYEAWSNSSSPQPPMIPVYWNRPEVLVSAELFEEIVRDTCSDFDPKYLESFSSLFPTYQITLTVDNMSRIRETTRLVREALGSDYGVYAVPEALNAASSQGHVVMPPDLHKLFSALIIGFSAIVVAGNIYIVVVQQKRKIGLFRVVGATSKDILQYVLTLVAYVSLLGTCIGGVLGNLLYLLSFLGSDMEFKTWFSQALSDFGVIAGLSVAVSLGIGFAIAYWASRLPCSEVLSRE
ncbi:MAG TPA: hypothetical protein PLK53_04080 [Bacillota bacterium]|nr:hypothetical protein [Bacillota bacterium]